MSTASYKNHLTQGNTKKEARARAASNILQPLNKCASHFRAIIRPQKQTFSEGLQPCGCLSEVVQARGMKYPEYTLLESKRLPWGWLFTMKVSVPGASAVGTGPTKKLLKTTLQHSFCKYWGFNAPSNKPESVTEECRPSTDLEVMDETEMDPQLILDQVHEKRKVNAQRRRFIQKSQHTEERFTQEEEIPSLEEKIQQTEEEIQTSIEDIQQIGEIQLLEEQTEHTEEEIQPRKEILPSEAIQSSFQQEEDPILVFVSLSEVPLQTDPEECECETQDQTLSLYDAEVFSQSQDTTTPECDQECSPEQPEVFHQVDTGSEEQSETQCEEAQVTDLISLSQVFCNIQTGSEEQSLCKTLDLSSSPSAEECQKPSSETHVIKESIEQEEHNSPPQILDGPPVSHFLIQALVRKLTQKSYFNSEDQGKIVNLLLEQTKERILNQNIPISVHNMRAVAKTAAKDLMKEIKLQKMP
ncbi:hypothetical protein WMY93_012506 [Mugilogobius chulae]|uniref:DRBM domain-containing protein n=1 Tax=Mugilogobius chulae TaxID=88201 RepID=A0AAW0P5L7_9GOBI